MFAVENRNSAIPVFTSCLESFQSSLRSISWKDSCDLGPFLISSNSMMKVSVLSGGILPDSRQHHRKRCNSNRLLPDVFVSVHQFEECTVGLVNAAEVAPLVSERSNTY